VRETEHVWRKGHDKSKNASQVGTACKIAVRAGEGELNYLSPGVDNPHPTLSSAMRGGAFFWSVN
jgi:hypothetical protein